jgi:hypothetical protein
VILNAIAKKLKRQSKDDFKGRHFEAWLIVQAVTWYLRYPMSYGDLESMFLERGFEVGHSTVNRWVLAYAPLIEKDFGNSGGPIAGRSASTRLTSKFAGIVLSLRGDRQTWRSHGFPSDGEARPGCRQAVLPQNAEGSAFVGAPLDRHGRSKCLSDGDFGYGEGGAHAGQAHASRIETIAARD